MIRVVVFSLLVGAGAVLAPDSRVEARGSRALAQDARGVGSRLALGALRPFYVQHLWWRLDRERSEGRHLDALRTLALLDRAEPNDLRATLFLAHTLARDIGGRESNWKLRLARLCEAAKILDEARARHGGDPKLHHFEAILLGDARVFSDFRMQLGFRNRMGEGPTRRAVAAARRGLALRPDHKGLSIALATAARQRAVALTLGDPEPDLGAAVDLLDEARDALRRAAPEVAAPLLQELGSWAQLLGTARRRDAQALASALRRLTAEVENLAPPPEGRRDLEGRLLELISLPLMDLSEQMAPTWPPRHALSVLLALNSMRTRFRAWRQEGDSPIVADEPFLTRLRTAIRLVLEREPELGDAVPPGLR